MNDTAWAAVISVLVLVVVTAWLSTVGVVMATPAVTTVNHVIREGPNWRCHDAIEETWRDSVLVEASLVRMACYEINTYIR